jgi:uncharacterized protein YdeI (YjbR/CyaY-like superfamily)
MDVRRSRTKNPDAWLASCPDFSRPICEQLREWIFRWQPDLAESVNTNMLCYTGRKRVVAIAGFKKHAQMVFFRGTELPDPAGLFEGGENNTNIRNVNFKSLDAIHADALRRVIRAAVQLDANPDLPPLPPRQREEWPMPEALAKALKKNKAAAAGFASLKPTYQREYKVWISTAKRVETLDARLKQTIAALAAGKKWAQRKAV